MSNRPGIGDGLDQGLGLYYDGDALVFDTPPALSNEEKTSIFFENLPELPEDVEQDKINANYVLIVNTHTTTYNVL